MIEPRDAALTHLVAACPDDLGDGDGQTGTPAVEVEYE